MLFSRKNKQRQMPAFSFCEQSAEGLKTWVSILPRRDTKALVKQLIKAGRELTASKCQLTQALIVIDILAEPLMTAANGLLSESFAKHNKLDAFKKRQEFFNLFGQIYYFTGQKQLATKPGLIADELFIKANDYLSNAVIASYQLYETPPVGCWRLLHSIYQYSLIDSGNEANALKLSACYKTIIGLACGSPEKLNTQQIAIMAEYLRTAVVNIRICAEANKDTHFAAITTKDQASNRYLPISDTSKESENTIYFDLSLLKSTLASSSLSKELAEHLTSSYGQLRNRAYKRTAGKGTLEVCSGIQAIHYYLCGGKPFEDFAKRFTCLSNMLSETSSPGGRKDVWNGVYSTNWQSTEFSGESIEFQIQNSQQDSTEQKRAFPIQQVNIGDLNPKGYRLSGNNIALRDFKPGTIIGIKNPQQDHWHVSVIRWSKTQREEKSIGVELFTPHIQPCGIKIRHSKNGTDFVPAFLLPPSVSNENNRENSTSLLLSHINLSGKTAATIINSESEEHIVLGDCIEQSGSYSRYLYTSQDAGNGKASNSKELKHG